MNPKTDKPTLTIGHRLQKDVDKEKFYLLYPEGMVELNQSATLILQLCDGQHTTNDIISTLEKNFPNEEIRNDVIDFIGAAYGNGWID